MDNFSDALRRLINQFCMEEESNTPDFILASYMLDCLTAYERAVNSREEWYGR